MPANNPNPQTTPLGRTVLAPTGQWATVVHDDPINLMSYVRWVFENYFGMTVAQANDCMLRVHHRGRARVSEGGREQMERDAQAMHTYGLKATIEPLGDAE